MHSVLFKQFSRVGINSAHYLTILKKKRILPNDIIPMALIAPGRTKSQVLIFPTPGTADL